MAIWSVDEAMKFADDCWAVAQSIIEEDGKEVQPICHLLHQHPGKEEQAYSMVAAGGDMFSQSNGKDAFADQVRTASLLVGSEYVIFLSEAWMKKAEDGEDLDELHKEYGSIEHTPGRDDVLIMQIDGVGGFAAFISAVVKTDGDSRTLEERTVTRSDAVDGLVSDGRFSNLSMRQMDN